MKKMAICLNTLLVIFGFSSMSAAPAPLPPRSATPAQGQTPVTMDCSHLSQAEQNFSVQIMNPKNREAFCSDFTMQQRQQAMQLVGQPDSSGNIMNADQAVQEVMESGTMVPMTQQNMNSSRGGCPVK